MNQEPAVAELLKITEKEHPFGNRDGRTAFQKLSKFVEDRPGTDIFGISLRGIQATDASFPRESVILLAKQYRGEKWFFLTDFRNRDLIDNWDYAAKAKDQPLVIWTGPSFEIIGPTLTPAARELVEYVLTNEAVLASQAAADLGISVPSASTRLKTLVQQGYIMRVEDVAESGGIEFRYRAIK
jgi:predicted transcriptional regulator